MGIVGSTVPPSEPAKPHEADKTQLRALTGTEAYVIQPRFDGYPSHIIVSVAHVSGSGIGWVTEEQVRLALHCTAQRFLDLRLFVRLGNTPGESRLSHVPDELLASLINKAVVVTIDDNWKLVVETEVRSYCPGTKDELPWKLCFVKNSDGKRAAIIHCADHIIEDGRSTQLFFSEFLANLSKVLARSLTQVPAAHKPLFDATLSSYDRRNESFSYLQTTKDIIKEIYRSTYATDQPPQTPIVPIEKRHYAFEFCVLDAAETNGVIKFSKGHNITVTSTLAGVALTAIKQAFEPSTSTPSYYTVVLGVDLRPHYKPVSGHDAPEATFRELFGSHIDVRRDTYGVGGNEQSLVAVAKQFDADTKNYIQSGRMLREGICLERYIPPIKTLAAKNNGRVGMLHYANLGVWQLPAEVGSKFKLDAIHFTSPTNLIGGTVLFNVQTVNDKLNLTFTFIDEIVSSAMRRAFLNSFMTAVKAMLG